MHENETGSLVYNFADIGHGLSLLVWVATSLRHNETTEFGQQFKAGWIACARWEE
jgi:hypothetical protein